MDIGSILRWPRSLVALLAVLLTLPPVLSVATESTALWRVVHDICTPDMRLTGHPAPCTKVDLSHGYAVLKDLGKPTQLLLVPTARVIGIEDPKLLEATAPNYWEMA